MIGFFYLQEDLKKVGIKMDFDQVDGNGIFKNNEKRI